MYMDTPIGGKFEAPDDGDHHLGPMQRIKGPMHRFAENETVDYVIVGVGSGGGVMLQRLARAGFKVIGLEAGRFWDTEKDWVSDEAGSHKLYWEDPRVIGGSDPLALGANNCGKGVGGGSVHWAAFTPRFHPSDFEVLTRDGLGADWPISYWDLKPYYELLELEMPVAGPAWYPWGDPHGYAYGPHPMGQVGNTLITGCTNLGIGVSAGGPVAILSGSRGDRPHCIYRGFCIQGCKVGAKASTLVTHVPDALMNKAEIRSYCMVNRIHHDKASNRVTGVSYFDREGKEHFQKAAPSSSPGTPSRRRASCSTAPATATPTASRTPAAPSANTLWRRSATSSGGASTSWSACTRHHPPTRSRKSSTRPIRSVTSYVASPCRRSARCPSPSPSR